MAQFERQFTKRRNEPFERKIAREVAILMQKKAPPSGRKAGPFNERHGRDRALDVTYWGESVTTAIVRGGRMDFL